LNRRIIEKMKKTAAKKGNPELIEALNAIEK